MSAALLNAQPTPVIYDTWKVSDKEFTIQQAIKSDHAKIVYVTQEAFFDPKLLKTIPRNLATKATYRVEETREKLNNPDEFTLLVCKVKQVTAAASKEANANEKQSKEKSEEEIVGTVYLKKKNTAYKDLDGAPIAEMGSFVVLPSYQGQSIGDKLLACVTKIAEDLKIRAIFLYAIGSKDAEGKNSNALIGYYEKHGFRFIKDATFSSEHFVGPDGKPPGTVSTVTMFKQLKGEKVKALVDTSVQNPLPTFHMASESAAAAK